MSGEAADASGDAVLAMQLLTTAPGRLGGMCLRGPGPARDVLVDVLRELAPVRRLPPHVDDEALLGGVDIAASLALGKTVHQPGLLEQVRGGFLLVPMAERVPADVAGRLCQAIDGASNEFGLILLDDGAAPEEAPPPSLLDRIAFRLDLADARPAEMRRSAGSVPLEAVETGDREALTTLAATAGALGIESVRALLFALTAARAHAALDRRKSLEEADLKIAARLVLAPRATRLPPPPQSADDSAEPDQVEPPGDASGPENIAQSLPEETVLDAALAAIPADLLARLAEGAARRNARGSGGGRKAKSKLRGKPLGSRPGVPRRGVRLALIDTLRAAVPWQPLRRREAGDDAPAGLLVRKPDLRVRRFEERAAAVTIFCVDASGSAAMARLAEAKGAVELMLAQAYVTRSEVALVAFRGQGAELLLPPTRSLTRARRALAELPGGGGTPLASGIAAAHGLAQRIAARGATPFLVFLTDGSANIGADGSPGRAGAREDAEAAARALARAGHAALILDIAPRPRPEAETLARVMKARYCPLPLADATALQLAVEAARPSPQAA